MDSHGETRKELTRSREAREGEKQFDIKQELYGLNFAIPRLRVNQVCSKPKRHEGKLESAAMNAERP
jgi:hypothetical protein